MANENKSYSTLHIVCSRETRLRLATHSYIYMSGPFFIGILHSVPENHFSFDVVGQVATSELSDMKITSRNELNEVATSGTRKEVILRHATRESFSSFFHTDDHFNIWKKKRNPFQVIYLFPSTHALSSFPTFFLLPPISSLLVLHFSISLCSTAGDFVSWIWLISLPLSRHKHTHTHLKPQTNDKRRDIERKTTN